MLRNNNQEVSARIGKKSIRENRMRFAILLGVTIVFVMAMTALNLGAMYLNDAMQREAEISEGQYHVGANDLTEEEALRVAKSSYVEQAGIAAQIGEPVNRPLLYRSLKLSYADTFYMKNCGSFPTTGHAPKRENEIAMDTAALDALELPRAVGTTVRLQWEQNGIVRENEFVLSGFWDSASAGYQSHIWVSEQFAETQEKMGWDLSANLKNPYFLSRTAKKIEQDAGLLEGSVSVNKRYLMSSKLEMIGASMPFWIGCFFVFLCGRILLGAIFELSVRKELPYYQSMKMQGMSGKQLREIIYYQARYLCGIGSAAGALCGVGFGKFIVGRFVSEKWNLKLSFHIGSVIAAIVFGIVMVLWAIRKPAKIASGKLMVTKMEKQHKTASRKKEPMRKKRMTIQRMAWREIRMQKKKTAVILTFGVGIGLCCAASTLQKSYRPELFADSQTISDLTLQDKSLSETHGYYNPYSRTISEKFVEELENLESISNLGRLYWTEEKLRLTERVHENLIDYFEKNDAEHLQQMSWDQTWIQNYEHMKATKECTAVVLGVDGLVTDLLEKIKMVQGTFDREKFESGNYIIVDTMDDTVYENGKYPNYELGDMVEIGGRTFEVMATANLQEDMYILLEGSTSSEAAFSPFFVLPAGTFQEMYPEHTIKKLFANVKEEGLQETTEFLEDYQKEKNRNLHVLTKEMEEDRFRQEIRVQIGVLYLIGITVAFAGFLSFLNIITVGIWEREKTFAALYYIGMTRRELRRLVRTEKLIFAGMMTVSALIFSLLIAGVVVRLYLLPASWNSVYTLSLIPLLGTGAIFVCPRPQQRSALSLNGTKV